MAAKNIKSKLVAELQNIANEMNLPIMQGREKGELSSLHGQVITIRDYGFLTDNSENPPKEYAAFIIDEDNAQFYFGGAILTDMLKRLDSKDLHDDVVNDGFKVELEEKTSKSKRKYTSVNIILE